MDEQFIEAAMQLPDGTILPTVYLFGIPMKDQKITVRNEPAGRRDSYLVQSVEHVVGTDMSGYASHRMIIEVVKL